MKDNWKGLTNRELKVVKLVCLGLNNEAIANNLFVDKKTIHNHLTSIYGKLFADADISSFNQRVLLYITYKESFPKE